MRGIKALCSARDCLGFHMKGSDTGTRVSVHKNAITIQECVLLQFLVLVCYSYLYILSSSKIANF